jgi:hypothetical protein
MDNAKFRHKHTLLGPKNVLPRSKLSDLQSQRLWEGHGQSGSQSLSVGLPHFLPEGGHGMDSVGVDMELDAVPCSQSQDDHSLAFPPITPSTSASPLQPITSSPQRTSWHLPTFFTPEPVRVSQQQVPSSATPSDLRGSHDAHIMRIEAPNMPLFTLSSSSYIEERPQSTESMPPSSSFPRCILPVMSTILSLNLVAIASALRNRPAYRPTSLRRMNLMCRTCFPLSLT